MATVDRHTDAAPSRVFEVLSEGWLYSGWVVGTSHMRAVDAAWPAVGSKLHHASGLWPLALHDETVVEAVEPDRSLTLEVRGRPLGIAKVVIEIAAEGSGSHVNMHESPVAGPGKWLHNPLTEAVLIRRNVETLARLCAISERRTHPS
jgi:hypothetical protein